MKFKNNIILFIVTFFVFLSPSLLFTMIDEKYKMVLETGLIIFVFGALILSFTPKIITYITLLFFMLIELIQFAHLSYYKFPISPHTLGMIWSEKEEIFTAGFGVLSEIWYFPLIVIIPYGLLIYLYAKLKTKSHFTVAILLVVFLGFMPYKIVFNNASINSYMPNKSRLSLYNSLKSVSYFIFGPKVASVNQYANYSYTQKKTENINVIVVFGESVNANYMSLFNESLNTSPKLNTIKDTLIYKKAFSAAPLTLVSTSMFFNVTREPDNPTNHIKGDVNLFKLAKENGFNTAYFSAQEQNLVLKIHPEMIDNILTKENIYFHLREKSDFYLIDLLKEKQPQLADKTQKNFFVLHQRNAHAPYDYNYRNHDEFNVFKEASRQSTYKNAMLMNDAFLYDVIKTLESIANDKPTYFYFVSDHSESLGDKDGRYGHGFLSEETVNIPFIYTCFNCQKNEQIVDLYYPTHYEVAKLIAENLGAKIKNPNENGDFYINGGSILGDKGFWTIKKDKKANNIQILKD